MLDNTTPSKLFLKISDKLNHVFYTSFNNFRYKHKKYCDQCGYKRIGISKNKKESDFVKYAEYEGLTRIGKYINETSKTTFVDKYGYKYYISYFKLKYGYPKRISESNPYSFFNIQLFCKMESLPIMLISTNYNNSSDDLMWKCLNCGKYFSSSWNSIQSGGRKHGCIDCKIKYFTGENNVLWNGGFTPLLNYLRNQLGQWNKDSIKSCNYKCVITNKQFDTVHHLYGFNKIVKETMDILNYPIYKYITDYTTDELENISNLCVKLHYKYGLGVCLSSDIHNLFHNIYGCGDNTPKQFEEFKQRYNDGEFDKLLKTA